MHDNKARIIFQHIPKTAGNSLGHLFREWFSNENKFICGKDGVLNDFLALDAKERNKIRLLIGHVHYGIHKSFEDESAYITFLREPIDRVLSNYYFVGAKKVHGLHKYAQKLDLVDYINSGIDLNMDNCMTRMISGINFPYGKCNRDFVDVAVKHIEEHYLFFGFQEFLQKSVKKMCEILRLEEKQVPLKNMNPERIFIDEISNEDLVVIERFNSCDIQLYNILKEKYNGYH